MTVTKLRQNLFKVLDNLIKTGIPVEIERRGKKIKIVAVDPRGKLDNLEPHRGTIVGDPQKLVHIDWSSEWRP
jgi:antitoxin (DNA-binding transcriptional repressor) of toxin-antitoxin stability system